MGVINVSLFESLLFFLALSLCVVSLPFFIAALPLFALLLPERTQTFTNHDTTPPRLYFYSCLFHFCQSFLFFESYLSDYEVIIYFLRAFLVLKRNVISNILKIMAHLPLETVLPSSRTAPPVYLSVFERPFPIVPFPFRTCPST